MSNADQLARQMRLSIERMNRNSDRIERRLRAAATVERIPAPQAAPAPVEVEAPVVE